MKMTLRAVSTLTVILFCSSVYAQDKANPRQACKEDIHTYCADVQPGGGKIISCLQDHSTEISDACHTVLQKVSARLNARKNDEKPPTGGDNAGGGSKPSN